MELLKDKLKVSEVIAYLLLQRKITTEEEIRKFFRGNLRDLHDPYLMKNMDLAVNRLNQALENKEKILIYGDYDVDGTTAVALTYSFLKNHAEKLMYYIPDRYKEGYGLSKEGVEFAKENNCSLIITLDCGIKAIENVDFSKSLDIDVIVCDHHTPGEELPNGIILDPKQEGCAYPYKELSGCGVGFKLLQALCIKNDWEQDALLQQLDLLAISIGADIVPVTGENRLLTQFGLEQLNQDTRFSIAYLLKLANKEKPLTLTDVVFTLAPRINAAGRLSHGKKIIELLISEDENEIKQIAQEIDELNTERKEIDKKITEEAFEQIEAIENFHERATTVVYNKSWNKGVVGIVASRLIEQHYRPTIVLTQSQDGLAWTGSARSISNINIYSILEKTADLLDQFGGHFHAAGLTIKNADLLEFIEKFEEEVQKEINEETLIEEEIIERELNFDELFTIGESVAEVPRLMRVLKQFEPFGPENMKPVFMTTNVFARNVRLLKEEHIKMEVMQPTFQKPIDAIFFRAKEYFGLISSGDPFDIVFTLEENQFRGRTTPQLMIKDIRPSIDLTGK